MGLFDDDNEIEWDVLKAFTEKNAAKKAAAAVEPEEETVEDEGYSHGEIQSEINTGQYTKQEIMTMFQLTKEELESQYDVNGLKEGRALKEEPDLIEGTDDEEPESSVAVAVEPVPEAETEEQDLDEQMEDDVPAETDWVLTEDQQTEESQMLLDNYKILKSNYARNRDDIESIFVQLMGVCPKKVTALWHALIRQKYAKIIKGGYDDRDELDYSYVPMNGILYSMYDEEEEFKKIAPYLLQDDLILPTMYQYGDIDYKPEQFLADMLLHEEYEKAELFLDLIAQNKLYDGSDKDRTLPLKEIMGYYGQDFCYEANDICTWAPTAEDRRKEKRLKIKYEKALEIFDRYFEKESDPKKKAKIGVAYLKMKKEIKKEWPKFE